MLAEGKRGLGGAVCRGKDGVAESLTLVLHMSQQSPRPDELSGENAQRKDNGKSARARRDDHNDPDRKQREAENDPENPLCLLDRLDHHRRFTLGP